MKITDLLSENTISIDVKASSKEDAFLIDFDVFDDAALRHQGNGLPDHVFF